MASAQDKGNGVTAREIFRVYLQYTKKYPLFLVFILIGIIGFQTADLIAPLYLKQLFNVLADNTPNGEVGRVLYGLVGLIAVYWLLSWAFERLRAVSTIYIETRVMTDVSRMAFEYLIGHSNQFFASNFSGSLTHRINKFSRAFEQLFDSVVGSLFPTTLFVTGVIAILFVRNQTLGLVLGLWSVGFVMLQIYLARLRQPIRVTRSETETRMTGVLADAISNQSTIALFAGERHERSLFKLVTEQWRMATVRAWVSDSFVWGIIGLSMIGIEAGMLYGASFFWQRGMLTVGDFVLIQVYLFAIFDRLTNVGQQLKHIYDALADAGEMVKILNTPHDVRDIPGAQPLAAAGWGIAFHKVSFFFHETHPVLKHLDFTVHDGERVALIGPSGAGKSTITRLILRLYDVAGGTIEIGGQNIARVTQESLRNAIAFVPQDPILFHRSLMDNIRYGRRDATDEEVIEAAKKAHCHEFIAALPEGYGTFVGERGVKLSGGERQRVAIARAILKNAPILVLDEATSSLDSESEHLIQDALDVLMRGKTVIVIAHRLSTIMKMDRIVVLDHGAVVAQGTHDELLAQGGLYQKLWSIQAGGFLQDEDDEEEEIEEKDIEEDPVS